LIDKNNNLILNENLLLLIYYYVGWYCNKIISCELQSNLIGFRLIIFEYGSLDEEST